jgi:hypothetical protein
MYKVNEGAIVLKMNVRFDFLLNGIRTTYTVTNFQSWRTTTVFLHRTNRTTDADQFMADPTAIRPTVRTITDTINDNGGWTLCGWLRRGEVTDASAAPNDGNSDVAGTNTPIHLAYVFPSNPTILQSTTNASRFAPPTMEPAFSVHSTGGDAPRQENRNT